MFKPTPQQLAIYDWAKNGRGNAIVEAVAGSGKTSTLIELMQRLHGYVAYCAYNKSIAEEVKYKLSSIETEATITASTIHAFGLRAWSFAFKGVKVENNKIKNIFDKSGYSYFFWPFINKALQYGRQRGIGIDSSLKDRAKWEAVVDEYNLRELLSDEDEYEPNPDVFENALSIAIEILEISIEQAPHVIDFDDMIYMPLYKRVKMLRYDWVLVDECQDLNDTRRLFTRAMLKPNGRLVAVGDSRQAIYAFAGANSDSMELTSKLFNCQPFPLTVSFRCPKQVVNVARRYVSHIESAENAPEGTYRAINCSLFDTFTKDELDSDSVVLCRNNKPIIQLAYAFLGRGIGCRVEGRDIGEQLLKLAFRWKRIKSLGVLRDKLQSYKFSQMQKFLEQGQEAKAEAIEDQVDSLLAIMDTLDPTASMEDLRFKINGLFGDTKPGEKPKVITLSSIHKSKGREWNRVYWYKPDAFQPSKYAKKPEQKVQEQNLMYVAATRAKNILIEVLETGGEMPPAQENANVQ